MTERVAWERFQWNCAGVRYTFEVQSGGLHGRMVDHGRVRPLRDGDLDRRRHLVRQVVHGRRG